MSAVKKILISTGALIGAVIVLVGAIGGYYLTRTGYFRTFPPMADGGRCTEFALDGQSAEDI